MRITTVFLSFLISISTFAAAKNSVEPLNEKDLSILNSGAACWLADSKKAQFIYDDMKQAVIKLSGKVIKLKRISGDWDSGFYICGQSYGYVSDESKVSISIKMSKAKADKCIGTMAVTDSSGSSVVSSLEPDCGV